jgi:hypothetical protein
MTAHWQLIETALKDGADLLLYTPDADPPVRSSAPSPRRHPVGLLVLDAAR